MKPSVFEFLDYKEFIRAAIRAAPKKGRGQLSRIAEAAQLHKTTLSQILNGSKDLSLEQAYRVAQYLALNTRETEFFVLLVNYVRAGSKDLQNLFLRQINARKKDNAQLARRVTQNRDLGAEEKAIFYSNWIYAAVRNLTAIQGYRRPSEIAKRLSIDSAHLDRVLDFLIQTGLCVKTNGELAPGPQMTHLSAESPIISRHHGNWRIKAMERHPQLMSEKELAYTAPMTLSETDALRIRALLAELVQRTDEIVGPSPSEGLYCMCLDWFEVR